MTQLTYHQGIVYTDYNKETDTLKDIVLFDGQDTYLFFDPIQIYWGKKKISLPPGSTATVSQDGSIELYNPDKDQCLTYQVDGYQDIYALVGKKIKFNLEQDILYRPDGKKQLLFSKPALLDNVD